MSNFKENMIRKFNGIKFKMQKNAPEIYFGFGVAGFVTTLILTGRQTLKAAKAINKHSINLDIIREEEECLITDEDGKLPPHAKAIKKEMTKKKVKEYALTVADIGKVYWLPTATGGATIFCFFKAYRIPTNRYLGAVSAFNAVTAAFQEYRKRVVEKEGEEADMYYMYGTTKAKIETIDENGKKTKETALITNSEDINQEGSVRVFDESNANYCDNRNFNMMFLRGQQEVANVMLHSKGHLFLNEVLYLLGYDQTSYGSVVGWLDSPRGIGHVDFGLADYENMKHRIDGKDSIIMLNFNHDGVIFDKIEEKKVRGIQ